MDNQELAIMYEKRANASMSVGMIERERRIARVLRSHDSLVAALKEMLEVYWGDGDGQEPAPAVIVKAKDALSRAEWKRQAV